MPAPRDNSIMKKSPLHILLILGWLLFPAKLVLAQTHTPNFNVAVTDAAPKGDWLDEKFDTKGWKTMASWDELSKLVKSEAWIRVEQTFSIKELNNLVVTGQLAGSLAMSVNGRDGYTIHGDGDKTGTWALTKAGIGRSATVDRPAVFGFHYLPPKGRPALCAVELKPLPLDYLEENTPTKKWVVMDGDNYLRDTEVTVGRDGKYYMTGTIGTYEFMFKKEMGSDGKLHHWLFNRGIPLWVSDDLKNWKSLGYVWEFDRDGTWAKEIGVRDGANARAIYAPEIHYLKKRDKYYIVYGPNMTRKDGQSYGLGILESREPQGPYKEVSGDKPICSGFDGNLFEDDDGSVYLLHNGGSIMKLKDDLSGPTEPERDLYPSNYTRVGYEGVYLFKRNGIYYLTGADWTAYKNGCTLYTTVVAMAKNIYGPYSARYFAYPAGGHSCVFEDTKGQWHATSFELPGKEMYPAIFPVEFDADNRLVLPKDVGVPLDEEMAREGLLKRNNSDE